MALLHQYIVNRDNIVPNDGSGLWSIYIGATSADQPSSGLNVGDLFVDVGGKSLFVADSTTTWGNATSGSTIDTYRIKAEIAYIESASDHNNYVALTTGTAHNYELQLPSRANNNAMEVVTASPGTTNPSRGDLLAAVGTTKWTNLTIGTSGKYVRSNGTEPSWQTISDSDISGTVAVSRGGTASTSFTAGSVIFAGASGTSLTQDNSNLFYDDTNNCLGLGTAVPKSILDINNGTSRTNLSTSFVAIGTASLGGTAGNYAYPAEVCSPVGNIDRLQFAHYREATGSDWTDTSFRLQFAVDSSFTDGSKSYVAIGAKGGSGFVGIGTEGTQRVYVDPSGNVGIGTTSFGASSVGVIGIGNATTAPTGNPTSGCAQYAAAGANKCRGSSGTVTTMAPA